MDWLLAVELVFVALSLSGSGWDDIPVSSHHVPPSHIYKLMEWFYLYILTQVMLTAYKLLDPRSPRAVHSGCREYIELLLCETESELKTGKFYDKGINGCACKEIFDNSVFLYKPASYLMFVLLISVNSRTQT